jgi:hypothetical protein
MTPPSRRSPSGSAAPSRLPEPALPSRRPAHRCWQETSRAARATARLRVQIPRHSAPSAEPGRPRTHRQHAEHVLELGAVQDHAVTGRSGPDSMVDLITLAAALAEPLAPSVIRRDRHAPSSGDQAEPGTIWLSWPDSGFAGGATAHAEDTRSTAQDIDDPEGNALLSGMRTAVAAPAPVLMRRNERAPRQRRSFQMIRIFPDQQPLHGDRLLSASEERLDSKRSASAFTKIRQPRATAPRRPDASASERIRASPAEVGRPSQLPGFVPLQQRSQGSRLQPHF